MEFKNIVRELYPNGMPMLIQGEYFDDDPVDPETCKLYPVFDDKVLPASPSMDKKTRNNIAARLNKILFYDDTPTNR